MWTTSRKCRIESLLIWSFVFEKIECVYQANYRLSMFDPHLLENEASIEETLFYSFDLFSQKWNILLVVHLYAPLKQELAKFTHP